MPERAAVARRAVRNAYFQVSRETWRVRAIHVPERANFAVFLDHRHLRKYRLGRLDLTDNVLTVADPAPAALNVVAGHVRGGLASGTWAGNGITSSTLAAEWAVNDRSHSLGYRLTPTGVDVAYTFSGDANLDMRVDVLDLGILATNYNLSGLSAGWPPLTLIDAPPLGSCAPVDRPTSS